MCIIEFNNVSYYYGKNRGIENISLCIDRPGVYALIGHNGSGKTTFIRMVVGLLRPFSGYVKILGREPYVDTSIRYRIGYLGSNPGLYPNLTVRQNLELFCRIRYGDSFCQEQVEWIAQLLELADVLDRKVKELSLGYIKRVAISRALMGFPEIIVLDEPFVHLDPSIKIKLRDYLKLLASKNKVVLFSSHILSEVELSADYLVVLKRGRLVFFGSLGDLRELLNVDKRIVVIELERAIEIPESLNKSFKILEYDREANRLLLEANDLNELLDALTRCRLPIVRVYIQNLTLEHLYKALEVV